eukprot:TRINITY_DN7761_c0_g1_i2.p3 TRINITY_DN7761_c0_g1~~TRINITY_DN7761_c0_g1_i2.p3  ORF type:complete len:127 (+),score=9.79 TRINITY_DN7761_c0_g1_i2:46-426(+)
MQANLEPREMSLCLMPQDTIEVIVGYLDLKSLIRLSNTCCWFRKLSCSFLRELDAPNWMQDTMLRRFTRLQYLGLMRDSRITDEGIRGMCLTQLYLRDNKTITDDGIKGMPITELYVSSQEQQDHR